MANVLLKRRFKDNNDIVLLCRNGNCYYINYIHGIKKETINIDSNDELTAKRSYISYVFGLLN